MLPPLIRLNKKMHTRASATIKYDGTTTLTGVDTLEWSDEKPYELVLPVNKGGPPAGKAEGLYKCSASIALYSDLAAIWEAALLIKATAMLGGTDITKAEFNLLLSYREDARIRTVAILDANVVKRSEGIANDGSKIVTKYDLQPRLVVTGGAALVNMLPSL